MKSFKTGLILLPLLSLCIFGCSDKPDGSRGDIKYVQEVNCVNNLKMIGMAFRVWARDHDQKFPYQISTNAGGALELVLPDKDGFDANAFVYLKAMTGDDELSTPLLLVCPQDKLHKAATGWTNLHSGNVTYRFCADTNTGPSSSKILAVCPVDGNALFCDGTVLAKSGQIPK